MYLTLRPLFSIYLMTLCSCSVENKHYSTYHSVASVEKDSLNVVIVSVTPEHGAGGVVQGESVGPQHVCGDEDLAVGAIHPGSLYLADAVVHLVLLPVCPVDPTETQCGQRYSLKNTQNTHYFPIHFT